MPLCFPLSTQVIYDLIDDVKAAMEGKLRSIEERVPLGKAEVKAIFGSGGWYFGGTSSQ
jgi:translation initiation factor IF-2